MRSDKGKARGAYGLGERRLERLPEVWRLLAFGWKDDEICEELDLSIHSIRDDVCILKERAKADTRLKLALAYHEIPFKTL